MARQTRELVARTFAFAQQVRRFVNRLPRSISNYEDARQLVRSSGSVAANYLEAQEGLSRKDFFYRVKVCRKESRESALWLRLIDPGDAESFQGFDRFRRVILHAAEDDKPVSRRLDLVAEDLELRSQPEARDLAFDQPLGGLRQRALRLADADCERTALGLAGLDQKFSEEMRLAGTSAAIRALVARRRKQRFKDLRGGDSQGRQ